MKEFRFRCKMMKMFDDNKAISDPRCSGKHICAVQHQVHSVYYMSLRASYLVNEC